MQKKFKHKKTGEIATYKDGVLKSSGFCVEIGVEPSSEFWEEVIEKDYEILSFRANIDILTIPKYTILSKQESGRFYNYIACEVPIGADEDNLLTDNNWDIHSVKRLSDGEVFTVGNLCNLYSGNGCRNPILRFEISYNEYGLEKYRNRETLKFVLGTGLNNNSEWGPFELDYCVHSKKPLFTTEDGVDIFKGDNFWLLQDIKNFHLKYWNWKIMSYPNTEYLQDKLKFSTKEAAENYIICNKPCLSFNDVWNISNNKSSDNHYVIIDKRKLKELVKSKL